MSFDLMTSKGLQVWHVENLKPTLGPNEKVVSLQADGDELERIIKTLHNVPYTRPITIWRGPMAEFIYENL